MTFEQMIQQDGFIAINFDLWLLLVNYKIPSIFISSKPIAETRFNTNEFVCYTENNVKDYVFILVPAMYRRSGNILPEYKLIINDDNINIVPSLIEEESCLNSIENAIDNYITVDDYLDFIFEKDITTKYKPRQKGIRAAPEFEIVEEEVPLEDDVFEIEPKKVRKLKGKKLKKALILEEAEEAIEEPKVGIENILFPEEQIDITPVLKITKKRKTRKQREQQLIVNPPGKKASRKKLPENIEIVGDMEIH